MALWCTAAGWQKYIKARPGRLIFNFYISYIFFFFLNPSQLPVAVWPGEGGGGGGGGGGGLKTARGAKIWLRRQNDG